MYYVDDHPKRNSLFFTGKNYDKETWFYFFNARYYSPELGRFISRDPIWIADDIHLYAYVKNNPLKFTDPSGMEKVLIVGFLGHSKTQFWEVKKSDYEKESIWKILNSFDSNNFDTKLYNSSLTKLWNEKWNALQYIEKNKNNFDKLILIWHSLWADNSVEISHKLKQKKINIDLLLTIDLQAISDTTNIPSNVLKARNYYQENDGIMNLEGDILYLEKWNQITNLKNIKANHYCDINSCTDKSKQNITLYHTTIDDLLIETYKTEINNTLNP